MSNTNTEYTNVMNVCRDIFSKKTKDYGTAWRILRPSSLTDQLFIKAQRIRTVQVTGENKVGENIEDEFVAIVNYCLMAIIQLRETDLSEMELSAPKSVSVHREEVYDRINEEKSKNSEDIQKNPEKSAL